MATTSALHHQPDHAGPTPTPACMDRLDAAQLLLGVSPGDADDDGGGMATAATPGPAAATPPTAAFCPMPDKTWDSSLLNLDQSGMDDIASSKSPEPEPPAARDRANSDALDALAALATSASPVVYHHDHTHTAPSSAPGAPGGGSAAAACGSSDEEAMPPPPPRATSRRRSASNPEGMEKWDSYGSLRSSASARRHFVLPTSIIEEELADANLACETMQRRAREAEEGSAACGDGYGYGYSCAPNSGGSGSGSGGRGGLPLKKRLMEQQQFDQQQFDQQQQHAQQHGMFGTSPNSVVGVLPMAVVDEEGRGCGDGGDGDGVECGPGGTEEDEFSKGGEGLEEEEEEPLQQDDTGSSSMEDDEDNAAEEEEEEANLEPAELLKRARARLFEDMSTECGGAGTLGEKGVLPLPHSLAKYKEVYNKNGRIGIYTPSERAAIIAKFQSKRTRRMWKKKIRYNCRKNLADRRMRVKGRFVKRSTEAAAKHKRVRRVDGGSNNYPSAPVSATAAAAVSAPSEAATATTATAKVAFADHPHQEKTTTVVAGSSSSTDTSAASSRASSPDADMPDVHDTEAGFEPTKKQPFRRTRRHTIT